MIQGSRISSAYLIVTPKVFLVMYNLLVCVESVLLPLAELFFFFFNVTRNLVLFLSTSRQGNFGEESD